MTDAATTTHLLYLHGFRSSPASAKARRLLGWLAEHRPDVHARCPRLPASPAAAWRSIEAATAGWPAATTAVVGSSLGGFYALACAEAFGWRALAINPAVDPARDLAAHVGEHPGWHDPAERIDFRAEHLDELRAIARHLPAAGWGPPERRAALIAEGDELLDWREMAARCAGATLRIVPGGDHALSDFDAHLPFALRALGLVAHDAAADATPPALPSASASASASASNPPSSAP